MSTIAGANRVIAFGARVGGFVAGLVLVKLFARCDCRAHFAREASAAQRDAQACMRRRISVPAMERSTYANVPFSFASRAASTRPLIAAR